MHGREYNNPVIQQQSEKSKPDVYQYYLHNNSLEQLSLWSHGIFKGNHKQPGQYVGVKN